MYWRGGFWRTVLWIGSLTALLCAGGAWSFASSGTAAQALVLVALVLSPPVQEVAARMLHVRAPPRLAFFATALLVPVAVAFIAIDGISALDQEARRQGFASAAEFDRARQLKIPTPAALAVHDEAQHNARVADMCRGQAARPPLACFPVAHRKAALAFSATQLDADEFAQLARDALADQRKRFLAGDKECQTLLDRIDEDALPTILASHEIAIEKAAARWAAGMTQRELEVMVERAKPGISQMATPESDAIEKKIDTLGPDVDRALAEDLQIWSQRLVLETSGWRHLLRAMSPVSPCRMVRVSQIP